VDFLRGLAVAGMILANNPGDYQYVYEQLTHAQWHGWTLTDFIFPLFLFLVGVSVGLSTDRERAESTPAFWPKVLRRVMILILLGLFENGFPAFDLESLRIPGVLQRIAVVYFLALWLHLRLPSRKMAWLIATVLLGYWLALELTPVPGLGYPSLGPDQNLEGWLDQVLLRGHLWTQDHDWDPEGILSTFPATALALVGVLAGRWLRAGRDLDAGRVFRYGLVLFLAGRIWNEFLPINKMLCTSSFVTFTAGAGLMILAAGHRLLDQGSPRFWARPFLALGANPLALYVGSETLDKLLYAGRVRVGLHEAMDLHSFLFETYFGWMESRELASLCWSLSFLTLMLAVAWVLNARKIYIKL
jgi:predicted acyltransferase